MDSTLARRAWFDPDNLFNINRIRTDASSLDGDRSGWTVCGTVLTLLGPDY